MAGMASVAATASEVKILTDYRLDLTTGQHPLECAVNAGNVFAVGELLRLGDATPIADEHYIALLTNSIKSKEPIVSSSLIGMAPNSVRATFVSDDTLLMRALGYDLATSLTLLTFKFPKTPETAIAGAGRAAGGAGASNTAINPEVTKAFKAKLAKEDPGEIFSLVRRAIELEMDRRLDLVAYLAACIPPASIASYQPMLFNLLVRRNDIAAINIFTAHGILPSPLKPAAKTWLPSSWFTVNPLKDLVTTSYKFTARDYALPPLHAAILHGQDPRLPTMNNPEKFTKEQVLVMIKYLLDHGADISAVDSNGYTALHYAANSKYGFDIFALFQERKLLTPAVINMLSSKHSDSYHDARDFIECNALQVAILSKNFLMAIALIAFGANPKLSTATLPLHLLLKYLAVATTTTAKTSEQIAAESAFIVTVQDKLSSLTEPGNFDILHAAAKYIETVMPEFSGAIFAKMLFIQIASFIELDDLSTKADGAGKTFLHCAAEVADPSISELCIFKIKEKAARDKQDLQEAYKEAFAKKDFDGKTPLDYIILTGNIQFLELLYDKEITPATPYTSWACLMAAIERVTFIGAPLILSAIANPKFKLPDSVTAGNLLNRALGNLGKEKWDIGLAIIAQYPDLSCQSSSLGHALSSTAPNALEVAKKLLTMMSVDDIIKSGADLLIGVVIARNLEGLELLLAATTTASAGAGAASRTSDLTASMVKRGKYQSKPALDLAVEKVDKTMADRLLSENISPEMLVRIAKRCSSQTVQYVLTKESFLETLARMGIEDYAFILNCAVRYCNVETVQKILSAVDTHALFEALQMCNSEGQNILHYAAARNDRPVLQAILAAVTPLNLLGLLANETDQYGKKPSAYTQDNTSEGRAMKAILEAPAKPTTSIAATFATNAGVVAETAMPREEVLELLANEVITQLYPSESSLAAAEVYLMILAEDGKESFEKDLLTLSTLIDTKGRMGRATLESYQRAIDNVRSSFSSTPPSDVTADSAAAEAER